MGFMEKANKGRDIFLTILVVVGLIGLFLVFSSLSFNNAEENTENLVKVIEDNAIPTPISWIAWISENVTNPLILLALIFLIFWLFKIKIK